MTAYPHSFSFAFLQIRSLVSSLFDFFDEIDEVDGLDTIKNLIEQWVKDDKGRNILYKNNGDERYPDFKLYKMYVGFQNSASDLDQNLLMLFL